MSIKIDMPGKRFKKVLFGEGVNEVPIAKLSRETGIPATTLRARKAQPWQITLKEATLIAKARGLSKEEILKMF